MNDYIVNKSKFYSSENSLLKNVFLIVIEFLNVEIMGIMFLLLPAVLYMFNLLRAFILILLKKLKRMRFIKFLIKKIRSMAYEQYEILILYYYKNNVYQYIVGKRGEGLITAEVSEKKKVIYTLQYIIDNFINTTERYIERFFLIFRRVFINAIFSLPDRIYYKIFSRDFKFNRIKTPTRFKLSVFYLSILSRFYMLLYWFELLLYYAAVFINNLFNLLYENRKNIFIGSVLFLLINLIFKECFSAIYGFLLSFFNFTNIWLKIVEKIEFQNNMNDVFNGKTKHGFFFKSEYKEFYSSSGLYKIYLTYLCIKKKFENHISNYVRFLKSFPPYTIFLFHKYFFFKKKFRKRKRRRKYKYRTARDRFVKYQREKRYRRKAVYEKKNQKKAYYREKRIWSQFFSKYLLLNKDLLGPYWWVCEFLDFAFRDRTEYFKTETIHNKRKYKNTGIFFKFLFTVLYKIFWLLKKVIITIFKNRISTVCFILVFIAAIWYFIINILPKRKKQIKIVLKNFVIFDSTLEEIVINFILNLIIIVAFYYFMLLALPVLHFVLFKLYIPFIVHVYRSIKNFFFWLYSGKK